MPDSSDGQGGGMVHTPYPGMGMRASHQPGVEHAWKPQVVHVPPGSGHFLQGVPLGNSPSHHLGGCGAQLTLPTDTALMACTILPYPLHRQRLPASASKIVASSGWGSSSSSAVAVISIPGVQ